MFEIGNEVVRTKGDYVVGRTGVIIEINNETKRARVDWHGETKTWVSFKSLALKSIPYTIIPSSYDRLGRRKSNPKYMPIN